MGMKEYKAMVKEREEERASQSHSKPNKENQIGKEMLKEFVYNNTDEDTQKIIYKIDQRLIKDPFFRINVWTKRTSDDRVVPTNRIAASFFVELLENGEIIDRTINAKLQSEN